MNYNMPSQRDLTLQDSNLSFMNVASAGGGGRSHGPSKSEVMLQVTDVIKTKRGFEVFMKHLLTEFSMENLLCIVEIMNLKEYIVKKELYLPPMTSAQLRRQTTEISMKSQSQHDASTPQIGNQMSFEHFPAPNTNITNDDLQIINDEKNNDTQSLIPLQKAVSSNKKDG